MVLTVLVSPGGAGYDAIQIHTRGGRARVIYFFFG
jgi:hypothetical protein